MKTTAIQLEASEAPKAGALERAAALLERARGSDLIMLPELWPTGFFAFDRYADDAEDLDGPTARFLRDRAKSLACHLYTGSFVERDGGRLYNTSLLIDSRGEILARYRKIHLFGHGGSEETKRLSPGREAVVVPTPWGRTGLSTCYDLRFPELYRRMVDLGAEIFLVTAAWPAARRPAWQLFTRARAAENQGLLLACNGAGASRGNAIAGHSRFLDPLGETLAEAGEGEELLAAEVDPAAVAKLRASFGALHDRVFRIEPPSREERQETPHAPA